ncbi:MAG: alpha/beta hydrolase [Planctomycetota bacterium]
MSDAASKSKPSAQPLIMSVVTFATALVAAGLFALGQMNNTGIFPGPNSESMTYRNGAKPVESAVFIESADGTRLRTTYIEADVADTSFHFLFCGGNAEAPGHPDSQPIKTLRKYGDVLTFDYRGFGNSKGEPSEAGLYQDARAVYAHGQRTYNWQTNKVVIVGYSLGGAPAIRLTTDLLMKDRPDTLKDAGPPAGLILQAPFSNIQQMGSVVYPWIPLPHWFALMHLDNLKRAPTLTLPVLHYHGVDDKIIPIQLGQQLSEAMPDDPIFIELPNTGHLTIWERNKDLLEIQIAQFLKELK